MTFHETFSAEQLFLLNAKLALASEDIASDSEVTLAKRTTAIMSCAFALEALLNLMLKTTGAMSDYDKIPIKAKLELVGILANVEISFGKMPWQKLANLIVVRNWLVHFKEPVVGFLGSEGYIGDNIPKRSPNKTLTIDELRQYYFNVLEAGRTLAAGLNLHDEFSYLWTQEFEPWIIG